MAVCRLNYSLYGDVINTESPDTVKVEGQYWTWRDRHFLPFGKSIIKKVHIDFLSFPPSDYEKGQSHNDEITCGFDYRSKLPYVN